eukprot:g19412.t1
MKYRKQYSGEQNCTLQAVLPRCSSEDISDHDDDDERRGQRPVAPVVGAMEERDGNIVKRQGACKRQREAREEGEEDEMGTRPGGKELAKDKGKEKEDEMEIERGDNHEQVASLVSPLTSALATSKLLLKQAHKYEEELQAEGTIVAQEADSKPESKVTDCVYRYVTGYVKHFHVDSGY